jgi:hypothetical protein
LISFVDPDRYHSMKATGKLPSPKGVAFSIIKLLQRDDFRVPDLVQLVQSDPAIAGRLLKFANAAAFGRTRPIVSLQRAIVALGAFRVRDLVIGLSVMHSHTSGQCSAFDYGLSGDIRWPPASPARNSPILRRFERGAVHHRPAGASRRAGDGFALPRRIRRRSAQGEGDAEELANLERERFAMDHQQLGATMLAEWGMPEMLIQAAYHHEQPDLAGFADGSRVQTLTHSLNFARSLSEVCMADEEARWSLLPGLLTRAARLGISGDALNDMVDRMVRRWREWGDHAAGAHAGDAAFRRGPRRQPAQPAGQQQPPNRRQTRCTPPAGAACRHSAAELPTLMQQIESWAICRCCREQRRRPQAGVAPAGADRHCRHGDARAANRRFLPHPSPDPGRQGELPSAAGLAGAKPHSRSDRCRGRRRPRQTGDHPDACACASTRRPACCSCATRSSASAAASCARPTSSPSPTSACCAGADRHADAAPQPPPRARLPRFRVGFRAVQWAADGLSADSISTTSSGSTIPTAMPPAMPSCSSSPTCSSAPRAPKTWSSAMAARSSLPFCPMPAQRAAADRRTHPRWSEIHLPLGAEGRSR